jgi:mRNA interferase MazF
VEFSQKQIWLINFEPSFGHEYKKVRPGLVIEDSEYIQSGTLLTVLPISSKTEKQTELDVYLPKDEKNRLMKDSLIKTRQISSFDKRRFIKYIGECNQEVFAKVLGNIKKYFSIEVENSQKDFQDHPTDEITDGSDKSNGEIDPQGHENEGNEITE